MTERPGCGQTSWACPSFLSKPQSYLFTRRPITAGEERQPWADWKRLQQVKEDAELEAEMERTRRVLPDTWTGG